jgi:NAD(P) transhydrogenase subunit alpha
MIVGVLRESFPGERRVALVPSVLPGLFKNGIEVLIECGAGSEAGFSDAEYEDQGARLAEDRAAVLAEAHVLVQVRGFGANPEAGARDLEALRAGHVLIGLHDPLGNPQAAQRLAEAGATTFALERLPRISRAQSMDVLSSMATVAGYKAVLMVANALDKMCPLLMTAAGTVSPARFLIIGAGVAGLQAIATARRLGAVVQAYDVRAAAKEQVESLGAKFLELPLETEGSEGSGGYAQAMDDEFYRRQRELMASALAESHAVVTTAAIPGQKAPILITAEMVKGMSPGSVIFDLAAEGGGNCELTQPGETIEVGGVTIMGPLNLPSTIPNDASQMYARNMSAFLRNLVKDGALQLDEDDPILRDSLLTHRGKVVPARVREMLGEAGAGSAASDSDPTASGANASDTSASDTNASDTNNERESS